MQHALFDIRDVSTTDGHLGASTRELLQPQWNVTHHIIIGASLILGAWHDALLHFMSFPNTVEVMLALGTIDGDTYGEVIMVLADEALHFFRVVVDAVGGE